MLTFALYISLDGDTCSRVLLHHNHDYLLSCPTPLWVLAAHAAFQFDLNVLNHFFRGAELRGQSVDDNDAPVICEAKEVFARIW